MKLRTSLCNPTALKKDITRFAPSWVLYSVGLFLLLSTVIFEEGDYMRTHLVLNYLGFMVVINIAYAVINVQLLFGDLFISRHCNAFHAMPLRRECWYVTHLIAGLLFSFVPNGLFALAVAPLLGTGAVMAGWWMLAVTLQYLFFFGVAVCSALCVGHRFAMVLLFAIVNFFSLIIWWFAYAIYQPLMTGVILSEEIFIRCCPVYQLAVGSADLINVTGDMGVTHYMRKVDALTVAEGWGYLAICAVIGVALLGVALALYRRRKLESAGDFMAVKPLEPFFLVLYTLCMAAFFQIFAELFGGLEYLFLALGLAVGYFTGRMLLMRTTRVFQAKGFLWFLIFVVVFAATMLLTALDVLGIVSYVPQQEAVKEVRISTYYNPKFSDEPFLTSEADIQKVLQIHQMILDGEGDVETDDTDYGMTVSMLYRLENGRTVTRHYTINSPSPVSELFTEFLTRPDFVMGAATPEEFVKGLTNLYVSFDPLGYHAQVDFADPDAKEWIQGLAEAIYADCQEGTMAQGSFHVHGETVTSVGWIDGSKFTQDGKYGEIYQGVNINIYSDSRHTVAYLTEQEIPFSEVYYD